jgi:hypothetical protein
MGQHWNQLKVVLHQKAKIEQSIRMTKACSFQKSAHHVGCIGETRIVKRLVCVFAFFVNLSVVIFFSRCFVHYAMQFLTCGFDWV